MILRLTDYTTTVDLIWHSVANRKYILARDNWAPGVAADRVAQLGGVGPWAEVIEEPIIHICGDTKIEVLQNQRRLAELLRQAAKWNDGEPGSNAVVMQYAASDGQLLEAVILGPADKDETLIRLDPSFNRAINGFMSQNVKLSFIRRGPLLAPAEAVVSSSATNIGEIFTIALGSGHDSISPVKLTWTAPNSARNPASGPLVLVADSSHIGILDAEDCGTGGAFATTTPATNLVARGGDLLRFTTPNPISGLELSTVAYADIPTILKSGPKQVDVWMVCGAGTGKVFQVYWNYCGALNGGFVNSAPARIVGPEEGIYVAYAGTIDVPEGGLDRLRFGAYGPAATEIMNIDTFYFIERRPTTFVLPLTIGTNDTSTAGGNVFGSGNACRGVWDSYQTTYPDPLLAVERTNANVRTQLSYRGDAWAGAQGATLAGVWIAAGDTAYRYPSSNGATTPLSVTFTAIRRKAYASPE